MTSKDIHLLRARLQKALRENHGFRVRIEQFAHLNGHLRQYVREVDHDKPETTLLERTGRPDGANLPPIFEPDWTVQNRTPLLNSEEYLSIFEGGLDPLDPSPGFRCMSSHQAPIRMGFQLLGLESQEIEHAVAEVESRQLELRDFIPLFVTDNNDFSVFLSRGYAFEYIPPSLVAALRKQGSSGRVLDDHLDLIKAKWNLRDVVDLSD